MTLFSAHYAHHPPAFAGVHIALFTSVTNAAALRAQIVQAATLEGDAGDTAREAVDFAFVDTRLVTSVLHIRTALVQAALAAAQGTLRTRTVHSEILWALSPTHNINDAIRRFGVSDASTALLIVRIGPADVDAADVEAGMRAAVQGELAPLDKLPEHTGWAAVKKLHKLNGEPALKALAHDSAAERAIVDGIVVTAVAMKGVAQ